MEVQRRKKRAIVPGETPLVRDLKESIDGIKNPGGGMHLESHGFEPTIPQSPKVLPAVQSIITSVFEIDFDREWKRLHDNLTIGNERNDHGTVTRALDFAEDNARAAHKLFINIRVEYERFEIDQKILQAGMRNTAHAELQAEKDAKTRTKQITDEDITSKMAELFKDEYRATELEKLKFRKTVEHAEAFAKVWSGKCETLRVILKTMRGGGG